MFTCRVCQRPCGRTDQGEWVHADDEVVVNLGSLQIALSGTSGDHEPDPIIIEATCKEEV